MINANNLCCFIISGIMSKLTALSQNNLQKMSCPAHHPTSENNTKLSVISFWTRVCYGSPVLLMRKGSGREERRESRTSAFQAFYNALGHENGKACCFSDEMARQWDLSRGSVQLVTTRSSPSTERRNDKYTRLHTIITFQRFPFFYALQ